MATGNATKPAAPTTSWTAAYSAAVARGNSASSATAIANTETKNNTTTASAAALWTPQSAAASAGSTGSLNKPTVGGSTTTTPTTAPPTTQPPATDPAAEEAARKAAEAAARDAAETAAKAAAASAAASAAQLQNQRNIAAQLQTLFDSYDLGSLSGDIMRMVQENMGADQITLELQKTSAYKTRFAANETRRTKSMNVLSPAEYIATERAYRQVMNQAGLPTGFYDQTTDFQRFLESDISATELQQRVQLASEAVYNAPSATKDIFTQYYNEGELIAYALDPTKAAPLIEQRIRAAEATAYGRSQGVSITQGTAESLGQQGFSLNQIQQGMFSAGLDATNVAKLSAIYDAGVTSDDLVKSTFGTSTDSAVKVKKLASQERGTFSGSSGASGTSLSRNAGGRL